jgi:hypothetical protein
LCLLFAIGDDQLQREDGKVRVRLTVEERIALLVTLIGFAILVFWCVPKARGMDMNALVSPTVTNAPRVWYFAATATDSDGLESDYSNELVWTNTIGASRIMCAWDAPSSTNSITNYTVFRGLASGSYTFAPVHAGTNLSVIFWLVRAPKTNRVVFVTTWGATGMLTAATVKGPWIHVDTTNATLTNPASSQFWRVEQPAKLFIREETY